jgi:hypothetical protein
VVQIESIFERRIKSRDPLEGRAEPGLVLGSFSNERERGQGIDLIEI